MMLKKIFKNFSLGGERTGQPLVVLGSSSSEVFDYIFGDAPNYFPYWASGWSARSLGKDKHKQYLTKILEPIPREANVILNFGTVDVNFICRHMAASKGIYDFKRIIDEAAEGILEAESLIKSHGFMSVYASFISPSISMPQPYWDRFNQSRQLPDRMLGNMYYDLFKKTSQMMPAIDAFEELSQTHNGSYLLAREFMRDDQDHHADYIKTQKIAWSKLSNIRGIIPMRRKVLTSQYPHVPAPINDLLKTGTVRPSTCR